jgi:hypothetical protein
MTMQLLLAGAETVRQAQRWDLIKRRYVDAGLCERCAAQAAWGHQDNAGGWDDLKSPCDRCALLVSDLPMATTNPLWRKYSRPQDHKRNGAAPVTPGEAVEDIQDPLMERELVRL